MRGTTAGIKVGLTAILILLIGFFAFRFVSKGIQGEQGYEAWALFKDATGLVDKSRVQIAGLNVGEITNRRLQGGFARVTVRIKPEVELWSNAAVYKRSASLLGEFYLEIDPGSRFTPDPLTGQNRENYLLKDCEKATGKPDCNQIQNVVEAITATDILVQVNETLPVLRDILTNVRKLTEGPMQDIVKQVQGELTHNAESIDRLLNHVDEITQDIRGFTHGLPSEDIRKSVENVREITEGIKGLVGTGEGQMNTTGDKIKRDLDKLAETLDHLNTSLEQVGRITNDVSDITGGINRGEGTVGRLLKDDAIAENVTSITDDAASFVRSLTHLQTIVGVREEWHLMMNAPGASDQWNFKTYLSIKLMPRPDKYYLIELIDDPRGSRTYSHTYQNVQCANGGTAAQCPGGNTANGGTQVNVDEWKRSPAFKLSFMFAKRIEGYGIGLTGRLGIKESAGGVGFDVDLWNQRLVLSVDLYDFVSEQLPQLKVLAALQVFEHAWLVAGLDDLLNSNGLQTPSTSTFAPGTITCGPATPQRWCDGGRNFFFGAQLTFNDEDLRALLTVAGSALAGVGGGK